jgi:Kef-type K+ transport system membrane component KefB
MAAMDDGVAAFITLGVLLLVGLAAEHGGRRLGLPSITILLLVGVLVGPEALDLLPATTDEWFPFVSTLALTMVGFLLGAEFTRDHIRTAGRLDLFIATTQGVATAVVVGGGLWLAGADTALALSLAGIAVATAPAATLAVVHEQRASGPFTKTLVGVVALDDVIALALFGLLASAAAAVTTQNGGASLLGRSIWEILGAIGLGIVLGLPAAALTGRLRPGRPTQEEAYAIVLLCAGLATLLEVSYLLAAVALGATLANRARHHEIAFHEIEQIEWPALIVFFVLAGASLQVSSLRDVGWLGIGYLVLRSIGKLAGCVAAGRWVGLPALERWWLGLAMLPQAGVAIGLSLLAADRFPEVADDLLAIVITATIVFELVGPVLAKSALRRAGEANPVEPGPVR